MLPGIKSIIERTICPALKHVLKERMTILLCSFLLILTLAFFVFRLAHRKECSVLVDVTMDTC
jgi:hypothetical protein